MKVLLLVLTFQTSGGLEIYTREVAAGLGRLGHEPEVWSFLERPGQSELDGISVRHFAPRLAALDPIHFRRLDARVSARVREESASFDLVLCMHTMLAHATHQALADTNLPYWIWTYGTDIWGQWSPRLATALEHAMKIVTISQYTA